MEPEIENVSSAKAQSEIWRLQALESRISWARVLTQIGALVCSFWLIYRVFAARGFLLAFFAFIALSIVYKFGVSPMFAVAASLLCFYFKAVGLWLPVTSYVVGAILLYVDVKKDKLLRRLEPL
jgi:hypothetical protein